jgi:hypothetical protein
MLNGMGLWMLTTNNANDSMQMTQPAFARRTWPISRNHLIDTAARSSQKLYQNFLLLESTMEPWFEAACCLHYPAILLEQPIRYRILLAFQMFSNTK